MVICETRDNGVREDEDFMTLPNYWKNGFCFLTKHVLLNYLETKETIVITFTVKIQLKVLFKRH